MSAAAASLIEELNCHGVRITRRGDKLHIVGPRGAVTPELKQALAAQKAELLAALSESPTRDRLVRLCDDELIDRTLVERLTDADVDACTDLADDSLRAYLRALHDSGLRERGKRPDAETVPAMCRSCGPVWLAPQVATVAPVIAGWPRVLGCPWCHVKNRKAIPRPPMACDGCERFERDHVNPAGGMGRCPINLAKKTLPFPHAKRECYGFAPSSQKESNDA